MATTKLEILIRAMAHGATIEYEGVIYGIRAGRLCTILPGRPDQQDAWLPAPIKLDGVITIANALTTEDVRALEKLSRKRGLRGIEATGLHIV